MRIGALSSFSGKGRDPSPSPAPNTFEQTMQNIPGLIALWTHGEDSGTVLNDVVGTRTGTISGTVQFNQPDLADESSIGAINYGGTGFATVPNDAGLQLNTFTLVMRFKFNSFGEVDISQPIFSKEPAVGVNDGDTTIYVDDTRQLQVRMQDGAASHAPPRPAEILVGETYSLVHRVGTTGFDVLLNGVYLGKNTNVTNGWLNNTAALEFASSPPMSADADIVLQYVGLYNRELTDAEAITFAQLTSEALPVAVDDDASVPESAVTEIDVLANDTALGTPTLQILAQPTPDSAAVSGIVINYTAGAVAADTTTPRQLPYRVVTPFGSADAIARVHVLNSDTPVVSNANCFTINSNDPVPIGSGSGSIGAALAAAIAAAPPGRTILINPGTYTGGTVNLDPGGTTANPVVVRPNGARGSVVINDAIWTLLTGSSRLVLANLYFNDSRISVNGDHQRISRCRFRQINFRNCIFVAAATDLRVDHCDFSGWVQHPLTEPPVDVHPIAVDSGSMSNGSMNRFLFDYNYIHDDTRVTDRRLVGGYFRMTGGTSEAAQSHDHNFVVDHNLFRNLNNPGGGHFLTCKRSRFTIRFCTFEDVGGYLDQRQGASWELRSNWFEGGGSGSGTIKMYDMKEVRVKLGLPVPLVIGNRFIGNLGMWVAAGWHKDGVVSDWEAGAYHHCRDAEVVGNILDTGTIRVGEQFSGNKDGTTVAAANNNIWNNRFGGTGGSISNSFGSNVVNVQSTGTTFSDPSISFVAAVKIAAPTLAVGDEVGMFAADPHCASGPQS